MHMNNSDGSSLRPRAPCPVRQWAWGSRLHQALMVSGLVVTKSGLRNIRATFHYLHRSNSAAVMTVCHYTGDPNST
uniref:Alternative protein MYO19 n=1 Tax=Homo sapiens TaxID=9606 RepID=L8E979_HUMAN|nr:alternative protein MYO19 [Homo sapiens]